jgi:hypothetical protein
MESHPEGADKENIAVEIKNSIGGEGVQNTKEQAFENLIAELPSEKK